MRVFVTGASGLLGSLVVDRLLARGDEVLALSRRPAAGARRGLTWLAGDVATPGPWQQGLDGVDAVVHLAGEPLTAHRWTEGQKARIESSRVAGTRHVVEALVAGATRPRVLVSASAVGFYGVRGEEALDENAPAGTGFLAELCQRWEAEAHRAEGGGVRVVSLRLAVVLSGRGGALAKMRPAFTLFVGGALGDPAAWFPWVHEEDAVGLLLHALDDERCQGPINVVAPSAVRMRDFARALGQALHRPAVLPVPQLALRLLLGEMASAINPGQKVLPRVALDTGYRFVQPALDQALAAALAAHAGPG
jgi:uncharacterized protein (TIGR01777 family)